MKRNGPSFPGAPPGHSTTGNHLNAKITTSRFDVPVTNPHHFTVRNNDVAHVETALIPVAKNAPEFR